VAQFIRLQGVVDNGAKRSPLVPRHTAREIQFPRLGDTTVEVCVSLPNGQPVMVGSNLTFAARVDACSGPALTKTGTFSEGKGTIQIASQETRAFCAGRLLYDVWLTVDGKKYQVVETSILRLAPNVVANP
jgi:hypothetical protein